MLLYFFTWWNIVGWSDVILSESLSMSFMFLWIATILNYYKKRSGLNLFFLIVTSFFLSFTRDTWPYIIFLFSIITILIYLVIEKKLCKKNFLLAFFSIILFVFQNYTSTVGERYKLPLFNSIVGRVVQNEESVKWFKDEGMPLTENIVRDFKGVNIDEDANRELVYAKYSDTTYRKLFSWILKDGKSVYQKFLVTHWSYLFLLDQNEKQRGRIFCSNLFGYTQNPQGFSVYSDKTFPNFTITSLILLMIILCVFSFLNNSKIIYFPVLLVILFSVNSIISYNADALEVRRHLFITQIIIEFLNILSVILVLDNFYLFWKNRLKNEVEIKKETIR